MELRKLWMPEKKSWKLWKLEMEPWKLEGPQTEQVSFHHIEPKSAPKTTSKVTPKEIQTIDTKRDPMESPNCYNSILFCNFGPCFDYFREPP